MCHRLRKAVSSKFRNPNVTNRSGNKANAPVFKIIETQILSEFRKAVRLKTIREAAAIFPNLLYSKRMKYTFCEKWIIVTQ